MYMLAVGEWILDSLGITSTIQAIYNSLQVENVSWLHLTPGARLERGGACIQDDRRLNAGYDRISFHDVRLTNVH